MRCSCGTFLTETTYGEAQAIALTSPNRRGNSILKISSDSDCLICLTCNTIYMKTYAKISCDEIEILDIPGNTAIGGRNIFENKIRGVDGEKL